MKQTFEISLVIGLFFGLIGAIMAFLITYEEYSHHYADKRKSFKHAIQTAIFTFAVFLVLTLTAVYFVIKVF